LLSLFLPTGLACSVADLSSPERLESGLVIVLPGIEGRSPLNVNIARGLDEGGVSAAIEIFDWTTDVPGGVLINLTDLDRNTRVAQTLRRRILNYQRRFPGRPVHLVGHSGGGGVSLLAIEALPRDVQITSAILLAPAVSPSRNLCKALRRTHYGIFNYHSKHDTAYLVWGTRLFGTIDRQYGTSAGAVGFERPPQLDEKDAPLYRKLHQIPWRRKMMEHGHLGGHTGWAGREFVREVLAPLVVSLDDGALPTGPADGEPTTRVVERRSQHRLDPDR
jgi:pimeloyl-ACP methyl ester carboxylesterase